MRNSIIKLGVCLMAVIPCMVFAHTDIIRFADNDGRLLIPSLLEQQSASNSSAIQGFELRCTRNTPMRTSESNQYVHAVVTEGGTLASVLGERIFDIDSISVEGPINEVDFNTLWESSFKGRLKIINLEKAVVENGKIPDYAFFHIDVQVDWGTMIITTTRLEKLLLPDGVTEIGQFAVAYSTSLTELKLPGTLQSIGKAAFTDCISLTSEQLMFPENLRSIGEQAFYQCKKLTGKITLPESLHVIMCGAFYSCHISDINIPRSLEYLGCMALANSRFKKAVLPDDCMLCPQGGQFYNNWELNEAHLPDKIRFVPVDVFAGCMSLQHANIPSEAITIGEFAFNDTKITEIEFPKTLESIGWNAFQGCSKLTTVVLPPSFISIADRAFALCSGLRSIYCMATVPPEYIPVSEYDNDGTPFASVDKSIPVYIPIGTKQQYMMAPGWDYMTNFIETDDFPYGAIDCVEVDIEERNNHTYDLSGRKIDAPVPGNIYIRNGKKFIHK